MHNSFELWEYRTHHRSIQMCSGWLHLRQVRHITVHAAVIICYLYFIKYSILGLEQQYIMLRSRQAQISQSENSGERGKNWELILEENYTNESKSNAVTPSPYSTWSYVPENFIVGQNNTQQSTFFLLYNSTEKRVLEKLNSSLPSQGIPNILWHLKLHAMINHYWLPGTVYSIHSVALHTRGHLFHPQSENPQCHGVREQINLLFTTYKWNVLEKTMLIWAWVMLIEFLVIHIC